MILKIIPVLLLLPAATANSAADKSVQPACTNSGHDGTVFAAGLGHNTFDRNYRSPFGAVKTGQRSVTLRFRTCRNDVDRVQMRVWDATAKKETWHTLQWEAEGEDPSLGQVEFWKTDLPVPERPTILYYFFELTDDHTIRYYNDNNPLYTGGGWGRFSESWNDSDTFQITVYDKDFQTPGWLKGAMIYQILPDRFRNGDTANDPANGGGFVFNKKIRKLQWNEPICDPRGPKCKLEMDNQFYGGDLQGVIEKLDYLKSLGVSAIYFNPVFKSATNHRYDTQDYLSIDPELGDNALFAKLTAEASARGMHVIIDGVFNHGTADSAYFDLFRRWDGKGACEAPDSPYRSWFIFPHRFNRPVNHYIPGTYYYCAAADGTQTTYEAWAGFYEHPVFDSSKKEVRDFFFAGGKNSVAEHWLRLGASAWRMDVASDISSGEGHGGDSTYWREFRKAVKGVSADAAIISEEWGDASHFLLGREMDATMNYRFRSAMLNWLADGKYTDENNNPGTWGGPLAPLDESGFDGRLRAIEEDYPPESWHAMMNLAGSHDTARILFVLKKISGDDTELARRKLKLLSLFMFTYPGAPTVLYGDEAGAAYESMHYDGMYRSDPYSRGVYPWEELGLSPDKNMIAHYARLGTMRAAHPALKAGLYETLLTDNARRIFAFKRTRGNQTVVVVLNRHNTATAHVVFSAAGFAKNGDRFTDALGGGVVTVKSGKFDSGTVPPLWGRVLVK